MLLHWSVLRTILNTFQLYSIANELSIFSAIEVARTRHEPEIAADKSLTQYRNEWVHVHCSSRILYSAIYWYENGK